MMAESDSNVIQKSNGNEDEDAIEPPVLAQKSLFGNSASLLHKGQNDDSIDESGTQSQDSYEDARSQSFHSEIDEPDINAAETLPKAEGETTPATEHEEAPHTAEPAASNGFTKETESERGIDDLPITLADELSQFSNVDSKSEERFEKQTDNADSTQEQFSESELAKNEEELEKMETDDAKPTGDDQSKDDETTIDQPKTPLPVTPEPVVSSRRSLRSKEESKTPKTAPKSDTRSSKRNVVLENEASESNEAITPRTTRGQKSSKDEEASKMTPKVEEEIIEAKAKSARRGRKSEIEPQDEPSSTPRVLRNRASLTTETKVPAATPKTKGALSQKAGVSKGKKQDEIQETPTSTTQTRTPKSSRKGTTDKLTTKEREQDPFDFDEMADNHPEPLKNIQVEVQSFGTVRFSKVGSGKYSNTEKAAEARVGIVTPTTPEKQPARISLMDLSIREAELSGNVTPKGASNRRSRKVDDEEMDIEAVALKSGLSKSAPPKDGTKKPRKRRSSPVSISTTLPKKAKMDVPVLNAEEQVAIDLPDEEIGLQPGARVFALYDKVFYPARVLSSLNGFGRVQVFFIEDELTKELPESAVIPISLLSTDRLAVIQTESVDIRAIIIEAPPKDKWIEGEYHLRSIPDGTNPNEAPKDYRISWEKLILDLEDWKDYVRSKDRHVTDVKKTNIELNEAKVTRSTRHSAVSTTPASTSKSTGRKSTPKRVTPNNAEKNREADGSKDKNAQADAKIFTGYSFLLTSANRQLSENQIPFKKNELKYRIQQRGGTIIESVSEANDGPSILISDTYYRTQKYLAALACDMPCVSHEWVLQCVKEEKFLDIGDYVLPAGMSIVDEQIHNCKKLKSRLLKGKRVCIYSLQDKVGSNLTFCEIWEPIARMLGAELIGFDVAFDGSIDYFITDPTCNPEIAKEAVDKGAIVLSSEWLIQTIIMGSPQPADAHPRFAYNFSGTQA